MPKSNTPAKSTANLLDCALNALKEHEEELDRISSHLQKVKEDLSLSLGKTIAQLDNLAQKIEFLDNKFHDLNQFINCISKP